MSTNQQLRKLIYYVATSVDGFIADNKGGTDGFSMTAQYIPDYIKSLQDYDTVLMGKHTYEAGYKAGIEPGQPSPMYAHMMQYVFSQSMEAYQHDQLQVIREDPARFVKDLKSLDGGSIYLCGGGKLAGYLIQHHLIDELILKVNPVIFGDGLTVFSGYEGIVDLILLDTKIYSDGNIFLHYQLKS